MSVSMRLTRVGGKKDPVWRVVVADRRSPRDGRVIETIGRYNAQTEPSTIVLDEERVKLWLSRGAQPSDTVRKLLKIQGIDAHRATMRELLVYLARALVDQPDASRSSSSRRTTARSCSSCRWPTMTTARSSGAGDAPRRRSAPWSRLRRSRTTAASSSTSSSRRPLLAGYVGRPHGLDGSFHVVRADPELLAGREDAAAGRAPRRARRAAPARPRGRSCASRAAARREDGRGAARHGAARAASPRRRRWRRASSGRASSRAAAWSTASARSAWWSG